MRGPTWAEVPEEERDAIVALVESIDPHGYNDAFRAALARLAEPDEAERWRAVPAISRAWALSIVEAAQRHHAASVDLADWQGRADAMAALLALARAAERGT